MWAEESTWGELGVGVWGITARLHQAAGPRQITHFDVRVRKSQRPGRYRSLTDQNHANWGDIGLDFVSGNVILDKHTHGIRRTSLSQELVLEWMERESPPRGIYC